MSDAEHREIFNPEGDRDCARPAEVTEETEGRHELTRIPQARDGFLTANLRALIFKGVILDDILNKGECQTVSLVRQWVRGLDDLSSIDLPHPIMPGIERLSDDTFLSR